jgi:sugar phosphate isomerase/epimerase
MGLRGASAKTLSSYPTRFKISLAQWSLRERIRSGKMSTLDFPRVAREEFDIHAVEYVSTFLQEHLKNMSELHQRATDQGVRNVLIMVDLPPSVDQLANQAKAIRQKAVSEHLPWLHAAKALDCHAIRVNARGYGDSSFYDAQGQFSESLVQLSDLADELGLSVLVENHGGYSSNGLWLSQVMRSVARPNIGTLPDFGNFVIDSATNQKYDPHKGLGELMPYAKGVSAKAHHIDDRGFETTIDYEDMMAVVRASSFTGYIGIEWGGRPGGQSPDRGIPATKKLLERLFAT